MKKYLVIILTLILSCTVDKADISYGEEVCSHCQMVIMDNRYGAELVTEKGKIYKFDAMECLINFKFDNPEIAKALNSEWTNVHDDPKSLFDASNCVYLRSPELPSPMGMYINAYKTLEAAEKVKESHGGVIYNWNELNMKFTSLPMLNQ